MCYLEKNEEFERYRRIYLACLSTQQFPWEPAYYYYMQNIDRIDVLAFEDFRDELLTASSLYDNTKEAFNMVSAPIYETLDSYFDVQQLIHNDKVIKLL